MTTVQVVFSYIREPNRRQVLPKQKGKELDKGEKNEKNPPKPKKGRRRAAEQDQVLVIPLFRLRLFC